MRAQDGWSKAEQRRILCRKGARRKTRRETAFGYRPLRAKALTPKRTILGAGNLNATATQLPDSHCADAHCSVCHLDAKSLMLKFLSNAWSTGECDPGPSSAIFHTHVQLHRFGQTRSWPDDSESTIPPSNASAIVPSDVWNPRSGFCCQPRLLSVGYESGPDDSDHAIVPRLRSSLR